MKTFTLLIETELQWLEESAIMRGVAEWLALGETALTVVVVLCSEDWLLDKVRADFRWNRERCLVFLKTSLENVWLVFEDWDSRVSLEFSMQMGLSQVAVSLFQCLSLSLVLSEEVVRTWSIKVSNLILYVFFLFLSLLDTFLVITCRFSRNWLLWSSDLLFLLLLLSENASKDWVEWLRLDADYRNSLCASNGLSRNECLQLEHIYAIYNNH